MDAKIIDTLWRTYSERVIPPNAPDIQRIECRRAFYGGAISLFSSIMTMLEPGSEPTDNDFQMMVDLSSELEQFNENVKTGQA